MSDLSRLLGDVYGTPTEEPPAAPDWADESVLDEAFADWVPGPPTDAPAAERAALSDLASFDAAETAFPTSAVEPPTTLAEALPIEAEWFFEAPTTEPLAAAAVVDLPAEEQPETAIAPWQRTDDDLLPARGRRRFRRR